MSPSHQIVCPCGQMLWLNRTSKRAGVHKYKGQCGICYKIIELSIRESKRTVEGTV